MGNGTDTPGGPGPTGVQPAIGPGPMGITGSICSNWELKSDGNAIPLATASGWSNPQTAASGTHFFINSFDVPSVHALADGTLAAHWEERLGTDEDSDASKVVLSWSRDHGRTWSAPVSPHHDGTQTEHGFVSLFSLIGSLFFDTRIYGFPNSGSGYDVGFVLGAAVFYGGIAGLVAGRSRAKASA